jgi:hypothetical protein
MYYKHSGRFTLGGLVLGSIVGGSGALLLAYAYARGIILITEAHVAAFATLAFGGLVGLAAGWGMTWGKVRSRRVAIAVTAVTSALALYVSWAMWLAIVYEHSGGKHLRWARLAQHPAIIWSLMKWINRYGTWGMSSGDATKGWELWLIWAWEAVLVIAVAIAAGVAVVQHRPFCEACGRWCRRGVRSLLMPPPDVPQLKLQLESNDLRPLEALGPGAKGGDHLIAALHSCTQCNQFHTLSLTNMTIRRNKIGQAHINRKTIVQQLVVGPGQAETLRQLSEKLTQAAKINPPKGYAAGAGN